MKQLAPPGSNGTLPESRSAPVLEATLPERNRRRALNIRSLVASVQAPQWRTLASTGLLAWDQLTREQKVLIREQIKLDFHDPTRTAEQAPNERVFLGEDIALRLTGAGVTARFGIVCMAGDGGVYAPTSPFYHPVTRELTWGVMPPR